MATRMATPVALGAIKDFDPEVDRIVPYLERVQLYLLANQVEAETKVPAFLSIIGGRAYGVLRDLLAPALPQDTSLERLVATLKKHYEPSKVVIAERFHFHRREQQAEESIAEFLAALRRLATHCQFGDHLEDSLRDRLVCGLCSESIQKKLLSEADLTLQRALEIAQGMESAERNTKALKQENWEVPVNNVVLKCHRCGKSNHKPSDCRFLQATCHSCGKKGHISPVCPSASQDRKYSRGRDRRRQKTNWLETDSPADESNLPLLCADKDPTYLSRTGGKWKNTDYGGGYWGSRVNYLPESPGETPTQRGSKTISCTAANLHRAAHVCGGRDNSGGKVC